jgi:ankyrin repeat protein
VTDIQLLIDAAVQDHDKARVLLDSSPALLNARYMNGETALHFLAVEGHADAVRFLASLGAAVDEPNEFGDTPLVDAALLGAAEVVQALLECGADPNAASMSRSNVVHAAASSGHPATLDLVLAAGGRHDYVTDLGEGVWDATSLHPETRAEMQAVLRRHGWRRTTKP